MSNILLISGLILIKIWAIGFFGFHLSGIIHILPVIAFLAFLAFLILFYKKSLLKNNFKYPRACGPVNFPPKHNYLKKERKLK